MNRLVISLLLLPMAATAQTWTQLETTGPSVRWTASAIHDPIGNRVVLFGGRGSSGDLNDVWALDLATEQWSELETSTEGPSARFSHNAVYDSQSHRMLIWSGRMLASSSTLLNDIWAFDLTTDQWTALPATTEAPITRYGIAAVFNPVAQSLVTFAGFTTEGRFDDTWRFNPDTDAWQDVTAASEQPGERCLHAAAYDVARRRISGLRSGPPPRRGGASFPLSPTTRSGTVCSPLAAS